MARLSCLIAFVLLVNYGVFVPISIEAKGGKAGGGARIRQKPSQLSGTFFVLFCFLGVFQE